MLIVVVTNPPRCPSGGVPATDVEEYELSDRPRVLAVACRCPRCGELVSRRQLGASED